MIRWIKSFFGYGADEVPTIIITACPRCKARGEFSELFYAGGNRVKCRVHGTMSIEDVWTPAVRDAYKNPDLS